MAEKPHMSSGVLSPNKLRSLINAGFTLAIAFLVGAAVVFHRDIAKTEEIRQWVLRARDAQVSMTDILIHFEEAEQSVGQFLLVPNDTILKPLYEAEGTLE